MKILRIFAVAVLVLGFSICAFASNQNEGLGQPIDQPASRGEITGGPNLPSLPLTSPNIRQRPAGYLAAPPLNQQQLNQQQPKLEEKPNVAEGMFAGAGCLPGGIPPAAMLYNYNWAEYLCLGELDGAFLGVMAGNYDSKFYCYDMLDIANLNPYLLVNSWADPATSVIIENDWVYYNYYGEDRAKLYRWNRITGEQQLIFESSEKQYLDFDVKGDHLVLAEYSYWFEGKVWFINLANGQKVLLKEIDGYPDDCTIIECVQIDESPEYGCLVAWTENEYYDANDDTIEPDFHWIAKHLRIKIVSIDPENPANRQVIKIINDALDNCKSTDTLELSGKWIAYIRSFFDDRKLKDQIIIRNWVTYQETREDEEQNQPTESIQLCLDIPECADVIYPAYDSLSDMLDGYTVIAYAYNNTCEIYLYDANKNTARLITQDASEKHLYPRIGHSTEGGLDYYVAWTQNHWLPVSDWPNFGGEIWGTAVVTSDLSPCGEPNGGSGNQNQDTY